MDNKPEPFSCTARPARGVKALAAGIVVLMTTVVGGALLAGGWDPVAGAVLGLVALLVALVAGGLAFSPARLQIDDAGVEVRYFPFRHSVPWSRIEQVVPGDRVDGVGWGVGWRWEGQGRIAVRVGGPMITVIHAGGRLGVSAPDQAAALAAAESWRPPTGTVGTSVRH